MTLEGGNLEERLRVQRYRLLRVSLEDTPVQRFRLGKATGNTVFCRIGQCTLQFAHRSVCSVCAQAFACRFGCLPACLPIHGSYLRKRRQIWWSIILVPSPDDALVSDPCRFRHALEQKLRAGLDALRVVVEVTLLETNHAVHMLESEIDPVDG